MLDGACRIEELLDKAVELKMPAMAITEHGNMLSSVIFHDQDTQGARGRRPGRWRRVNRYHVSQRQPGAHFGALALAFNGGVTGDSLADLLLGRAFSYTETSDHKSGSAIFTDLGLYAQDQFRANARLSAW